MSEKPSPITKADIAAAIALGRAMIADRVTKHRAAEAIYDSLTGGDRVTVIAAVMEATGMTQEEAAKRHFYERSNPRHRSRRSLDTDDHRQEVISLPTLL